MTLEAFIVDVYTHPFNSEINTIIWSFTIAIFSAIISYLMVKLYNESERRRGMKVDDRRCDVCNAKAIQRGRRFYCEIYLTQCRRKLKK